MARILLFDDGTYAHGVCEQNDELEGRDAKAANAQPFLWKTHKGKYLQLEDMATPHLINAINMIWNNLFDIKNDHPEVGEFWSGSYVDRAAKELTAELQKRVENFF